MHSGYTEALPAQSLRISDRMDTLAEMVLFEQQSLGSAEKFYLFVLLTADQLSRAEIGSQRLIFDDAVRGFRTSYPHDRSRLFISALRIALFLYSGSNELSVRNAGPLDVMTHKSAARRGNPSGIVATALSDEKGISWAEGKIIFKISTLIEDEVGAIVRRLAAGQLLTLRTALRSLIREQHACNLLIPSIFKLPREQPRPAPTVAKQRIALLAKYPTVLCGAADPVTIVSDVVSLAESIAFSAPENLAALTRAAYHIFFQSHPQFERDLFTTLMVSALNEATDSLDYSWQPRGDHKEIAVLKDARLSWRFNPEGCFAAQSIAKQSPIADSISSKTSALLESALRAESGAFERNGPSRTFMDALSSSVPFIGTD